MAQYPEGNPGVFPLDPTTDTGRFRLAYGDITSTPYDPVEPGYQNYGELSDEEIEAFIAAGGSVNRGIGYYYLQLAGKAALVGRSVKDFDLSVDTKNRAADLRSLAEYWFGLADDEDGGDAFFVVPTGASGDFIPEGTVPIYGRRYTWDRWHYDV